jgi:integrase
VAVSLAKPAGRVPDRVLFRDLADEWLELQKSYMSQDTWKLYNQLIRQHILPSLGGTETDSIRPKDILAELVRPLEAGGHTSTSHLAVALTGRIFRFGVASGQCERDCTHDLKDALAPHKVRHFDTTSNPDEIRHILLSIDNLNKRFSEHFKNVLQILPYVFTRPNELCRAEWKEIDLEDATWRIPAERMKGRKPHIVPLARQVVRMFKKREKTLENQRITSDFVFPDKTGKSCMRSNVPHVLEKAVGRKGLITPHGFRAMASTILNEKGYSADWIERQLAHVEGNGVRAAYNHAQYLPERRKMMQDWANWLDRVKSGKTTSI